LWNRSTGESRRPSRAAIRRGAGIQADLKTFAALRLFGTTVITAITAQNSLTVSTSRTFPEDCRGADDAVLSDFPVNAPRPGC
jgi:hydroxymethylpyrimidine/phosphomethylpyrimidine kinase